MKYMIVKYKELTMRVDRKIFDGKTDILIGLLKKWQTDRTNDLRKIYG